MDGPDLQWIDEPTDDGCVQNLDSWIENTIWKYKTWKNTRPP